MTVGAIGVILVMMGKVGTFADISPKRMAEIADDVAREAMRQDGLLLAQLLSTDTLDSRAARVNFRTRKPHGRQKSRGKRSEPSVREFTEVVDFYLNETRRRMVILGAPGTGKTALAVFLTVGLLKRRAAPASPNQIVSVPCLFNLPSWDPARHDLTDWLETQIVDRFRLGRKIAARLVRDGWILPVLDGLDEMDPQEAVPRRSENAVSRINDYIARTPDSHIVVVCRSGSNYYERLARGVRDADEITVQNLKPRQIIDYIQTQCPNELSRHTWQPVFDALAGRNSRLILSVLDTPWRLTAAVTFALTGGDPATLLPAPAETTARNWHSDYSRRISQLLMETFVAARISIHSKSRRSIVLTVTQLRIVANLLMKMENAGDGGKEIILHQWWKAFGIGKIVGFQLFEVAVLLQLPFGLLSFLHLHYRDEKDFSTTIAILVNFVTIVLFSSYYAAHRKGPVTLRIRSLRSPDRVRLATLGMVYSAIFGVLAAIAAGPFYGIGYGITNAAMFILITASYGLDPANATRPTATLVNDRNFAIIIGVAIGGYATLYYIPIYGLVIALMFASMCVLGSVLSSSYTRYLITVFFGGFRGLPLRFASFLSWCHSAGILRASGIGYQFRHQELLDYLTCPERPLPQVPDLSLSNRLV
jgi:hypothetical protein